MAYIVGSAGFGPDGNVNSIEIELPSHRADDYICIIFSQEGGVSTFSSSGYTVQESVGTPGGGGNTTGFLYKKATSSSEPNPVVTSTRSDASSAIVFIVRDADPTTFIDASNSVGANSGNLDVPSITTTADNALVISWAGHRNFGTLQWTNKGSTYWAGSTGNSVHVKTNNKATAGAIASERVYQTTSQGRTRGIVAINNKAGGLPAQEVSGGAIYSLQGGEIDPILSPVAISSRVSTIDGIVVQTPSVIASNNTSWGVGKSDKTLISAVTANAGTGSATVGQWTGYAWPMNGADLSDSNMFFSNARASLQYNFTERYGYYFEDGLGNWVVKDFRPFGDGPLEDDPLTWFGDFSALTTVDSSGTIDFSDIDYWGPVWITAIPNNSNRSNAFWHIGRDNAYVFTGGGLTPRYISEQSTFDFSYNKQYSQGKAQDIITQSIQIGDGTNKTVFIALGSSLEHKSSDELFTILPNSLDFSLLGAANDVFDFRQSILITDLRQNFTIDSSSSISATYEFDSAIINNYTVTWRDSVVCDGASFIGCDEVNGKAGIFENCTFVSCSPNAGKDSALSVTDGAEVKTSTFTKADETYAIEIVDAGSYDFTGTTWNGYTTDINVLASSGTVTIVLAAGQTQPTYSSAGATVVFSGPSLTGQIIDVVAGSRLQIYNITSGTELYNALVTGTSYSYSYTDGGDISAGDEVRVRLAYQNGTTAREWFEVSTIAGSAGWNVVADQNALPAYADLGVDGSTVSEFSLDGANIEVDANDLDGVSDKKRLVAWYYYAGTLAQGIREFFGGIVLEDSANAKISTSVLDLKVDNISSVQLRMSDTDFRLYRDDGATWVKYPSSGGYGIDTDSGKVFAIESGSGLSPSQLAILNSKASQASVNALPSASDNADAVWSKSLP